MGAIDAAALGPFKKEAHYEKKRQVFSVSVVISLVVKFRKNH